MTSYYENHLSIRKNRLCPFLLKKSSQTTSVPCNWHKNIELIYVTEGKGAIQYSAESISISAGDFIVINSGVIHRPYSDEGLEFYYLIIDDGFCLENGIDVNEFLFEKTFRDESLKAKLSDVIEKSSAYEENCDAISAIELRCSVLSLLSQLCKSHAVHSPKKHITSNNSEEYVKKVLEYVNKNFNESIRLETLAEICGITKFHLIREFKKHTGQTVFSYINTLRCQNAEICISNGMSVTEAAYANGFESLSYFSRTYKNKMGTSPSKIK